jgi:hypothetical protein
MVTAVVNNPGAAVGQEVYQGTGAVYMRMNKATGIIFVKGDILIKDTGTAPDSLKLATAGAATLGPFYIATAAAATGDTKCSVAVGGLWYVTGGDTIEPGDDVMVSTTVAGQTVKSTTVTTVAHLQGKVGVSLGFADSFGTGLPVASVVGDLYVLDMNAGNRG